MSDLKSKVARFKKFNSERKTRASIFNVNKSNMLFKIIPFLLHSNYPDLPGYIDDQDCPHGIVAFNPEGAVDHELFRRYFPNSTALRTDTPNPHGTRPCIHSLKTIGSIGTIAQTELSDCDYWVSIKHQEVGEKGLALLQEKWYERDGDVAQYDAAVQSLDVMDELRPKDPRTEQIRQRLMITRQAKEAAAP